MRSRRRKSRRRKSARRSRSRRTSRPRSRRRSRSRRTSRRKTKRRRTRRSRSRRRKSKRRRTRRSSDSFDIDPYPTGHSIYDEDTFRAVYARKNKAPFILTGAVGFDPRIPGQSLQHPQEEKIGKEEEQEKAEKLLKAIKAEKDPVKKESMLKSVADVIKKRGIGVAAVFSGAIQGVPGLKEGLQKYLPTWAGSVMDSKVFKEVGYAGIDQILQFADTYPGGRESPNIRRLLINAHFTSKKISKMKYQSLISQFVSNPSPGKTTDLLVSELRKSDYGEQGWGGWMNDIYHSNVVGDTIFGGVKGVKSGVTSGYEWGKETATSAQRTASTYYDYYQQAKAMIP